jgi:hypothetical protein
MVYARTLPPSDDNCKNDGKNEEEKKASSNEANEKGWKL